MHIYLKLGLYYICSFVYFYNPISLKFKNFILDQHMVYANFLLNISAHKLF